MREGKIHDDSRNTDADCNPKPGPWCVFSPALLLWKALQPCNSAALENTYYGPTAWMRTLGVTDQIRSYIGIQIQVCLDFPAGFFLLERMCLNFELSAWYLGLGPGRTLLHVPLTAAAFRVDVLTAISVITAAEARDGHMTCLGHTAI